MSAFLTQPVVDELSSIKERILRMVERITVSADLPLVEDRNVPLDDSKQQTPMMDNIHVLRRSLREFNQLATGPESHGLYCQLRNSFSALVFFDSCTIFTKKGYIKF